MGSGSKTPSLNSISRFLWSVRTRYCSWVHAPCGGRISASRSLHSSQAEMMVGDSNSVDMVGGRQSGSNVALIQYSDARIESQQAACKRRIHPLFASLVLTTIVQTIINQGMKTSPSKRPKTSATSNRRGFDSLEQEAFLHLRRTYARQRTF